MSQSRLANVVVIFIVAFVAFGVSSVVGFSTGEFFGIDFSSLDNNSGDTNSSNPFSFYIADNSNQDSGSYNNYQTSNEEKNSDSSSNNDNSSNNNQNNNNDQNNNQNNNDDNNENGESNTDQQST